eukprot:TRINITY_DN97149_c0_g1_i1.p1 TRINITY_DN97149_c0_g1~~TRINITY_DN97149_c0_g1_i1.p1  ORF type:complete len:275 (+),score=84.63 TRINITY_DN97149_c0_g1_i1:20-844(+)
MANLFVGRRAATAPGIARSPGSPSRANKDSPKMSTAKSTASIALDWSGRERRTLSKSQSAIAIVGKRCQTLQLPHVATKQPRPRQRPVDRSEEVALRQQQLDVLAEEQASIEQEIEERRKLSEAQLKEVEGWQKELADIVAQEEICIRVLQEQQEELDRVKAKVSSMQRALKLATAPTAAPDPEVAVQRSSVDELAKEVAARQQDLNELGKQKAFLEHLMNQKREQIDQQLNAVSERQAHTEKCAQRKALLDEEMTAKRREVDDWAQQVAASAP